MLEEGEGRHIGKYHHEGQTVKVIERGMKGEPWGVERRNRPYILKINDWWLAGPEAVRSTKDVPVILNPLGQKYQRWNGKRG